MRDELRRERTARAGLIVDKDGAEAGLYLVGPRPADDVEHATRRKRKNEPDRPIGIGGRGRVARLQAGSGSAGGERQKFPARKPHDTLPFGAVAVWLRLRCGR